eukprot:1567611-Lingulodinium_polyedra.AAC.1
MRHHECLAKRREHVGYSLGGLTLAPGHGGLVVNVAHLGRPARKGPGGHIVADPLRNRRRGKEQRH